MKHSEVTQWGRGGGVVHSRSLKAESSSSVLGQCWCHGSAFIPRHYIVWVIRFSMVWFSMNSAESTIHRLTKNVMKGGQLKFVEQEETSQIYFTRGKFLLLLAIRVSYLNQAVSSSPRSVLSLTGAFVSTEQNSRHITSESWAGITSNTAQRSSLDPLEV